MGSVPVGDAVSRLPGLGVTHIINCRAGLQTRISHDLWVERQVFGADHVMAAPMWDHGRAQPPALTRFTVSMARGAVRAGPSQAPPALA